MTTDQDSGERRQAGRPARARLVRGDSRRLTSTTSSDNKAVVGQLFVIGKTNRFVADLLTNGLPTKSGDEVNVPSQMINVAGALTNTSRYHTYPDR